MTTTVTKPKRTKQVFPTAEVFHKWASQSQSEGRNPTRNVFFHGKTIYSYGYHFPIASFVEPKLAKRINHGASDSVCPVVLFTNRSYSNTTAKHLSHCRRAITHCVKVYCANPEIDRLDNEKHVHNLKDLIAGIEAGCEAEAKAVKHSYTSAIQQDISNLANYVALFKLKTIKPYISTYEGATEHNNRRIAEAKALTKKLRLILSLENDPLAYAKILGLDLGKAAARIAHKAEKALREQQEREASREKQRLERLERDRLLIPATIRHWRNGGSLHDTIPWPTDYPDSLKNTSEYGQSTTGFSPNILIYNLPTMLRLKDGQIETSLQARINVETAKRIWPTLQAKQNPGDVEGYRGVGFNHAQEFIIGCHKIPFCELELMAEQLGLIKQRSTECLGYDSTTCTMTTEGTAQ